MNKIKSLFIGMYPMFAMGISGYGIFQLISSGFNLIWLGAILVNLPIMLFIARIMMFKDMARTSAHFPLITLLGIVGVTLAVFYGLMKRAYGPFEISVSSSSDALALAAAITGFILYLLYNYWYSSLGRGANGALQIGRQLPSFEVRDTTGKPVNSTSYRGFPTVFIFFRGNWCPLCMAQIKEIVSKYRELAASGAKVALISPQPEKNTQSLAAKFHVPFDFLTDVGNRAANALGIEMKNGLPAGMEMLGYDKDTVYPTVIITDKDGKIIYSDQTNNYRIRPEPDEFIKILKECANPA